MWFWISFCCNLLWSSFYEVEMLKNNYWYYINIYIIVWESSLIKLSTLGEKVFLFQYEIELFFFSICPMKIRAVNYTTPSMCSCYIAIKPSLFGGLITDTTKRLMSSTKCRSVEVINNPARPGSNHREVNCINYK